MSNEQEDQQPNPKPDQAPGQTTPRGNQEADRETVEQGKEKLDQVVGN
jgi:hypothetical protein